MRLKETFFNYNRKEWAWIFYDWANSAYSIMITTAVFPIIYNQIAAKQHIPAATSTAYLGYANSIATLLVGVSAPLLGALADYRGYRNKMFTLAALLGMLAVLSLAIVPQGSPNAWFYLLVIYIISVFGFAGANIFYDAALIDVTTPDKLSRVSSTGYAMGYLGSNIPFILFIFLMSKSEAWALSSAFLTKFAFVLTVLWWFMFTLPYWRYVDQTTGIAPSPRPLQDAWGRIKQTFSHIRLQKHLFLFLAAYFLYIDGVDTIIKMATSVGTDFGVDATALIILLLLLQFVAFPSSIIYGRLAHKFGEKPIILLGIGTYIVICCFALLMTEIWHFYVLGVLVGTAQGGIQSLSRSFYGKLIPENRYNEYYGIFNIFGRFSSILGTTLLGVIAQITGNSLMGVFSVLALFIIGGVLFLKVESPAVK